MAWACVFVLGAEAVAQPSRALQTVALSKEHVPVLRQGRTVAHKTAYFGTVFIGLPNPQPFSILFDTGSGHVVLPSRDCSSDVCKKHRSYQRQLSASARDVGDASDGSSTDEQVELEYGTGKVSGDFINDVMCLSNSSNKEIREDCPRVRVVLASSLTADPFSYFSFDGVIGLGLESLAKHSDSSFFGQLLGTGHLPEPCFSVFLSKSDEPWRSEIAFGGHNDQYAASSFDWAPVEAPEQGYWQVAVRSVLIGGESLKLCADGGCRAVLDTGTSMLGVPGEALSDLHRSLARVAEPTADCRHIPGPQIIFDLGGFKLRLDAEDYSRPAPMAVRSKSGNISTVCRASLLPVPSNAVDGEGGDFVFVFGEPFLQKHYTKYDWKRHRIGFALAQPARPPQVQLV